MDAKIQNVLKSIIEGETIFDLEITLDLLLAFTNEKKKYNDNKANLIFILNHIKKNVELQTEDIESIIDTLFDKTKKNSSNNNTDDTEQDEKKEKEENTVVKNDETIKIKYNDEEIELNKNYKKIIDTSFDVSIPDSILLNKDDGCDIN